MADPSDESKPPQRAESPKPVPLEGIKQGFSEKALEILSEYERYKAIMNPEDFEHWYQEKMVELEQRPAPRYEAIRGLNLKPVKFD